MEHLMIPSHQLAMWLLTWIDGLLEAMGFSQGSAAEEVVYTTIIIVVAFFVGWILRWGIVLLARHTRLITRFEVGRQLVEQKVITRSSHIVPPLLFLSLIPFAFESDDVALEAIKRIAIVYLLITIGVALCSVFGFLWTQYDRKQNTRNLPLRGVLNVVRGVVWLIVVIVSASVLMGKSPAVLLTGLGAFAAALMLIFKDSIQGFVAGIQIAQNDMLRVGDWVIVPSTIANGIVTDVTLSAVKIRNWDNTIVTLPPYTLVSTSFQNWRGMSDSGVRLIARAVLIDNSSIKAVTARRGAEMLRRVGVAGNVATGETNLSLLRRYLCEYLRSHPMVDSSQTIIVRLMPGDAYGTPLQVYCYAKTTQWVEYENIQSEIVEHVIASCPTFHLEVSDCNVVVPT